MILKMYVQLSTNSAFYDDFNWTTFHCFLLLKVHCFFIMKVNNPLISMVWKSFCFVLCFEPKIGAMRIAHLTHLPIWPILPFCAIGNFAISPSAGHEKTAPKHTFEQSPKSTNTETQIRNHKNTIEHYKITPVFH